MLGLVGLLAVLGRYLLGSLDPRLVLFVHRLLGLAETGARIVGLGWAAHRAFDALGAVRADALVGLAALGLGLSRLLLLALDHVRHRLLALHDQQGVLGLIVATEP